MQMYDLFFALFVPHTMDSEVSERIQVLKAKAGEYGTFFVISILSGDSYKLRKVD